ncbi:uncharacterized protein LOC128269979 [Anopheles cruzii]|uniref:uncharacterized protein LOC128269979 n=1 Tax=Anopheles cruzii TaxID=68878 RepID=UPI0022EC501A|nr:uncharacterized protein LOC128269979 [Anopheles cruzii]
MRNEESISPAIAEAQSLGLQKLRQGYQELYDEIDRLSSQSMSGLVGPADVAEANRQNKEVDDLLATARKFIRETRSSMVTYHDHGVQCEPELGRSKMVATPSSWVEKPELKESSGEESLPERKTAIKIAQIVPKGIVAPCSDQSPLNNKAPVGPTKAVRNIGTNVNFVAPRAAKRTNLHGYVIPAVQRPCMKSQTAPSQRSPAVQPVIKPCAISTAKPSGGRKASQPLRSTFTDDQFKKLFDRFLLMHPAKEAKEGVDGSGDHAKEAPEVDKTSNVTSESVVAELEPLPVPTADQPLPEKLTKKELDTEKVDHTEKILTEESVIPSELLGFTTEILPSVSIKGRWDANLKVRQTSNIAIADWKEDERNNTVHEQNVKYLELNHVVLASQTKVAETEKPTQPVTEGESEHFRGSSDLNLRTEELKDNNKGAININSSDTKWQPGRKSVKVISLKSEAPKKHFVRVPKSACKVAASRTQATKSNKYLEPFVGLKKDCSADKLTSKAVLEIFDDDSSTSDDDDFEPQKIRSLLKFNSEDNSDSSTDREERPLTVTSKTKKLASVTTPKTVQCQRSLLEVSSIPALRSPSEMHHEKSSSPSSEAVEYSSGVRSGGRFLENLRIWKSAVEVQSQNLKLGNELTESLDVLKDNIRVIQSQATGLAKMTPNFNTVKNYSTGEPSVSRHREPPFGSTPPPDVRPKSCECFGCQSTFDEPVPRPTTSPSYEHKQLQRAVFEQNPRYARTISKICSIGHRAQWERRGESSGDDAELAKKAAHKFLQSWQKGLAKEGSSSSGSTRCSSSISFHSTEYSLKQSDGTPVGGRKHLEAFSEAELCSDLDNFRGSNSSLFELQSYEETELSTQLTVEYATTEDSSSLPVQFRNGSPYSDEGEVLSHGEIK